MLRSSISPAARLANAVIVCAALSTQRAASEETALSDLSTTQLEVSGNRLLVNLMMEGRLAWFSWMGQQRYKPKLIVEWSRQGRNQSKVWQHGLDGSDYPQTIFLRRGQGPGGVQWDAHADNGSTREGHKHHFFSKDAPPRCGFLKADLSEIPPGAAIVRAELVLHIHDTEGLKAVPDGEGVGRFRHVNKDWDWNDITFTHYAAGKPWWTPIERYPFLGDGDVSPVLWQLHRQKDVAARGYHKRGKRDYPLDLTPYVRRLQQLRMDGRVHFRSAEVEVRKGAPRGNRGQAADASSRPLPGQIVIDPEHPRWLKRDGGKTFFERTDFYTLDPHDELRYADSKYVLADPGRSYIAYSDRAKNGLGLKGLPVGSFSVDWLDCRTGRMASTGRAVSTTGDTIFDQPEEIGEECAAWIRLAGEAGRKRDGPKKFETTVPVVKSNRPPQASQQSISTSSGKATPVQLLFEDDDGPGPYSYSIVTAPRHGSLSGTNNDRVYTPKAGFVGADRFQWQVTDGKATSEIATVIIHVRRGDEK